MRQYLLVMIVVLVAVPGRDESTRTTTQPSTKPTLIPASDAPTLADRLGPMDALTIRYSRSNGDEVENWDVVIKDRAMLARFEAMRRSDVPWVEMFETGYQATARFGDTGTRHISDGSRWQLVPTEFDCEHLTDEQACLLIARKPA